MKKKIIFLFIISFSFLLCSTVFADTITCDYSFFTLTFDTRKYDFFNEYIQLKPQDIGTLSEELKSYKPLKVEDCPKKIYIAKYIISMTKPNSGEFETYELKSSSIDIVSKKVNCGNITGIPKKIPQLISFGFKVVQVAVPVILVLVGAIDIFKGITSQKEDEMKKGRQVFIKRLILAALIFFVVVIVKFLVSVVADNAKNNIADCIDCFISNDC